MSTRIEITIKDTLGFWNEDLGAHTFNPNGYAPTNTYVYGVPDDWIRGDSLSEEGLERVYAHLYGPTWRRGNDDGSAYFVLETRVKILPADDPRAAKELPA